MPVLKRLDALEEENKFLRELLCDLQWLTVAQVAKALRCSERTVFRLLESNRLEYRKEGKKPMVSLSAVRFYLTGKKIDPTEANYRLMSACQTA